MNIFVSGEMNHCFAMDYDRNLRFIRKCVQLACCSQRCREWRWEIGPSLLHTYSNYVTYDNDGMIYDLHWRCFPSELTHRYILYILEFSKKCRIFNHNEVGVSSASTTVPFGYSRVLWCCILYCSFTCRRGLVHWNNCFGCDSAQSAHQL